MFSQLSIVLVGYPYSVLKKILCKKYYVRIEIPDRIISDITVTDVTMSIIFQNPRTPYLGGECRGYRILGPVSCDNIRHFGKRKTLLSAHL